MRRIQNFTPATYATDQSAGQKRRRLRPAVSCDPCRLRKVKCNQGQPCGSCTLRGRAGECVYGGDLGGRVRIAGNSELRNNGAMDLELSNDFGKDRMSRLEAQVEELQQVVLGLASELPAWPALRGDVPTVDSGDGAAQPDQPFSAESNCCKPMGIRDGIFASKQGTVHFIGPTGWTIHLDDVCDAWSFCEPAWK